MERRNMVRDIRFYKADKLPTRPVKDAVIAVLSNTENEFSLYVTDINGVPVPLKDLYDSGIQTISNTDGSITITGTSTDKVITLSSTIQNIINSALQSGDNITNLINNAGYITLADLPTFNPSDYDLTEFTNTDSDPFARISDLNSGVTNLAYTPSPTQGTVTSDTGTDAIIPLANGTNAGLITAIEKTSISTALQPTDNISELTNNVGYITSFTETDPIFTASEAFNITNTDITNLSNLSGVNTGDQDLSPYQLLSEKGVSNGYVPLDSGAKIDISYLPDSVVGKVEYQGAWNAATNTPDVGDPTLAKGHYYVVSTGGTYLTIEYAVGDWIISNGVDWEKVDNTDAVVSVFGRIGAVVANSGDYAAFYEPIFSKNTAFNKDFGSTAGTVSEGNHTHTFASLTSKPTTISGYGITDFNSLGDARWSPIITGGASSIVSSNLTANRALVSNGSGKVAVSDITSTELGYLDNVTSNIQTQLNTKLATSSYTAADVLSKLLTVDGSGSGLDADLLDGLHASSFIRTDTTSIKTSGDTIFNNGAGIVMGTLLNSEIFGSSDLSTYWDLFSGNLIIRDGSTQRFIFERSTGNFIVIGTVTATNFILSSDERLKSNIKPIGDIWREFEMDGVKRYGVVAQEIEKTNPELVHTNEEGYKSVAYIDLLCKEMAEKDKKIQELESRLEKLEKHLKL